MSDGPEPGWAVTTRRASVRELHEAALVAPTRPEVRVAVAAGPALVLGSTQSEALLDREAVDAAGLEVVRRRTGGGAVLLRPGQHVWVDVRLPADDPRWDPEPAVLATWLGARWQKALGALGLEPDRLAEPASTGPVPVCFGALGRGEVAVGGRKVVGIAQRRSRGGVVLQSMALVAPHDPAELVRFLALPTPVWAARLRRQVEVLAMAPDVVASALVDALVA